MSPGIAPDQTQTITYIAYGIAATLLTYFTFWQGHRAWRPWREQHCLRGTSQGLLTNILWYDWHAHYLIRSRAWFTNSQAETEAYRC